MNPPPLEQMEDEAWNARRKELQDALIQAANELTTFSRASRMEIFVHGIRVIVKVETPNRKEFVQ
jgi:hypothetical protein